MSPLSLTCVLNTVSASKVKVPYKGIPEDGGEWEKGEKGSGEITLCDPMEYTLSVVKNIHMYVHVRELVDIVEHQLTEIYESFCRVAVQEFSPSLLNVPNYHESENITQL